MKYERIVLIDDDADLVHVLTHRLANSGYVAEAFTDSREAVRFIRQAVPDLVIADIKMPGLNGFEVYDLIRKDVRTQHIPIIMLTGVNKAKEQVVSINEDHVYYVAKADGTQALIKTVQNALDFGQDQ